MIYLTVRFELDSCISSKVISTLGESDFGRLGVPQTVDVMERLKPAWGYPDPVLMYWL